MQGYKSDIVLCKQRRTGVFFSFYFIFFSNLFIYFLHISLDVRNVTIAVTIMRDIAHFFCLPWDATPIFSLQSPYVAVELQPYGRKNLEGYLSIQIFTTYGIHPNFYYRRAVVLQLYLTWPIEDQWELM
jgi:hypothetical protein